MGALGKGGRFAESLPDLALGKVDSPLNRFGAAPQAEPFRPQPRRRRSPASPPHPATSARARRRRPPARPSPATHGRRRLAPARQRRSHSSRPRKQRSEEEWRAVLSPKQFYILRQKGTESVLFLTPPFSLSDCGGLVPCSSVAACANPRLLEAETIPLPRLTVVQLLPRFLVMDYSFFLCCGIWSPWITPVPHTA